MSKADNSVDKSSSHWKLFGQSGFVFEHLELRNYFFIFFIFISRSFRFCRSLADALPFSRTSLFCLASMKGWFFFFSKFVLPPVRFSFLRFSLEVYSSLPSLPSMTLFIR